MSIRSEYYLWGVSKYEEISKGSKLILSDRDIRAYVTQNNLVTPFREEQLNAASYDVAIGDTAKKLTREGFIDLDISQSTQENPYIMMPEERLLVATLERFNMPDDLCGFFYLKSSRARGFIEHLHATFIDPGYTNSLLTLELKNDSPYHEYHLYKGFLIGQIVFNKLSSVTTKSYQEHGSYNNADTVESSNKIHEQSTIEPTMKLAKWSVN